MGFSLDMCHLLEIYGYSHIAISLEPRACFNPLHGDPDAKVRVSNIEVSLVPSSISIYHQDEKIMKTRDREITICSTGESGHM